MSDEARLDKDDLEALKGLFLGEDLERLRRIDEESRSSEERLRRLAEILPLALKRLERRGELNESLAPTVEAVVRLLIQRDSQRFADALYPAIGPAIRRSISETIRQLLRNLNQALEVGLSWQGIKWRFEAWRSGVPYGQVVLLHNLHYRVEQVFLIHRHSGLLLAHVQADGVQYKDPDMVSSMLSAIGDFIKDSFEEHAEGQLGQVAFGELSILVEPGPDVLLAVAVRGDTPPDLRRQMQELVEDIQRRYATVLADFDGDMTEFSALEGLLEPLLQQRLRLERSNRGKGGLSLRTRLLGLALLLSVGLWLLHGWWWDRQEQAFVQQLRNEPGLVLTSVDHEGGKLRVEGLRDPLARDPRELLSRTVLDPDQVSLAFSSFQSLQPEFVHRRLIRASSPPPTVNLRLVDGRLVVEGLADAQWIRRFRDRAALLAGTAAVDTSGLKSAVDLSGLQAPETVKLDFDPSTGRLTVRGEAPEDWIEQARESALKIPGVQAFDSSGLQAIPDPARFEPPETVQMIYDQGVLKVEGSAKRDWIDRLRAQVADYPVIRKLDTSGLVDLDEQEFKGLARRLEQVNILFDSALSFNLSDRASLDQAADLALQLVALARRLGRPLMIIVKGHTDSTGSFEDNRFLSLERADFVAQQLFLQGVPASVVRIQGIDRLAPPERSAEERRFNRRVSFEVLGQ